MTEKRRKKRILYIEHYAGSPGMGMEFRPYYLAREWMKMGYRVDILAADYSHLRTRNPVIHHDFECTVEDGIRYHWVHTGEYSGNGVSRALTMEQFVCPVYDEDLEGTIFSNDSCEYQALDGNLCYSVPMADHNIYNS